ncbi:MAG: hypothetical protein Ta2G_21420 [Termitinemataceae bacterium]|nr:MAG: hypothetical protein Ta2G_21420 [Termitinemataceae bacterium]
MNNILYGILGLFGIGYGIYTAIIRKKTPEKLGKIGPMKERFGDKTGNIIHIIAYTVMPILVGIIFAISALQLYIAE